MLYLYVVYSYLNIKKYINLKYNNRVYFFYSRKRF